MKLLSIIIPAFNESATIGHLIEKILTVNTEKVGFKKEIIVVDDGSEDHTYQVASNFKDVKTYRKKNAGKGSAVRFGISKSFGDYVLIQDADLEYDPSDYIQLLNPIFQNTKKNSKKIAIFGSRVMHKAKYTKRFKFLYRPKNQKLGPWLANKILSITCFMLYGKWISDLLTGYKVYPGEFIRKIHIKTNGFETDHEITAKLINNKYSIIEVPITYNPRSIDEGKKIKPIDGIIAVLTLIRFILSKK